MNLLTNRFLNKFDHAPSHMNELGSFVYYRTYSRYLPEKGRRETWKETAARSADYNVSLAIKHLEKQGYKITKKAHVKFKREAEKLFEGQFMLRQFLSGRTLWVGGAEGGVADKYPLANFNCSFVNIQSFEDIGDLFYLLLVGTGVGVRSSKDGARNLPALRNDVKIVHEPFIQRYPVVKISDTSEFLINGGTKLVVHIGDSKEGWVNALRILFRALQGEGEYKDLEEIGFYYDYIRPKGSRLHTFGGTASGHEPLLEMFKGIEKVILGQLDTTIAPPMPAIVPIAENVNGVKLSDNKVQLRPVHILDIANLIGNNVVVGGVRRTAEIFLFDEDDYESLLAKYGINGIWDTYNDKGEITVTAEEKHERVLNALRRAGLNEQADSIKDIQLRTDQARPFHHRRMSNNSVAFVRKPTKEYLDMVFTIMREEGEPGFINFYEAAKRRLAEINVHDEESILELAKFMGLNPCAEILLDSYGVCNLTTINVLAFVKVDSHGDYYLDERALMEAQKLSVRAGMRMTLVTLEMEHWNKVQKRDALTGNSLTGFQDAMGLVGYTEKEEDELLRKLRKVAKVEGNRYAKEIRTTPPLLDTTVKPEGTLSQVAGGVSSGVHYAHAPFFIRRVRINANDPLAKVVAELGWRIHAEVGTDGFATVDDLARPEVIANAKTIVVDFPVKSTAKKFKEDVSASEQLDIYFRFQRVYTAHNTSNTITVKPHEWEGVADKIYDNWDNFVGVSFLSHDGGSYTLAPYEEITEEQYNELVSSMKGFDPNLLEKYENGLESDLDESGCESGKCPVR